MGKAKIINNNVNLTALKLAKDAELRQACESAIGSTFQSKITLESTGQAEVYGIDIVDQQNMSQKLLLLATNRGMIDVEFKVKGRNTFAIHTREEFIAIVTEIGTHIEAQRIKLGALRILLDQATTDAQVLALSWNSI